ncbi:hypothetical protein PspLS_09785 [Pyricularia sp. CBS 133598]|nr:hypothetical protein PspLS_09785 [Pyricularia sp. CBS 133598]
MDGDSVQFTKSQGSNRIVRSLDPNPASHAGVIARTMDGFGLFRAIPRDGLHSPGDRYFLVNKFAMVPRGGMHTLLLWHLVDKGASQDPCTTALAAV